ncbi:hypothetical protein T07_4104 [Trichinella nelsoni]|uniref:Uncharacterized protein n=1 Tax=Trichinella nelsoni TaxID=6336 RepID=A0A0V0RFA0_9BILA|nr:hypothetical protein T07_4104 [Trichinella nelsoni]
MTILRGLLILQAEYPNISSQSLRVLVPFSTTHLSETGFSSLQHEFFYYFLDFVSNIFHVIFEKKSFMCNSKT